MLFRPCSDQLGFLKMAGGEKYCKFRLSIGGNGPVPYSQLFDLRSAQTLNERVTTDTTAEFLKGLPSYNENNFARFQPDQSCKSTMKKSTIYYPAVDHPSEQIITTERTSILLRYLQQQYEKKKSQTKRDIDHAGPSRLPEAVPRKKSRLQNSER